MHSLGRMEVLPAEAGSLQRERVAGVDVPSLGGPPTSASQPPSPPVSLQAPFTVA